MKTSPEKTSSGFASAATWIIVGSSVGDVHYATTRLVAEDGSVGFEGPAGWEVVPHRPPRLQPGDKRIADTDLGPLIERLGGRTTNGGGGTNSARELEQLRQFYRLPIRLGYIDTATPWPELATELSSLRVEHRPLGLTPAAKNLVLTNGSGAQDRMILKGSVPSPAPLNGEWVGAVAGMGGNLKAVLINSVKSKAVARAAVNTARQLGAALYSVATPSIPIDARIDLLLPNCQLTQFNLAEFKELSDAVGIACPTKEEHDAIAGVGKAVEKVCKILPCHDLVVTMGETGMVLREDSAGGLIAHLGLTDAGRAQTRRYLRADQICGMGDETFSALTRAHKTADAQDHSPRLVSLARCAWSDVLRGKSPFLQPRDAWFTGQLLA